MSPQENTLPQNWPYGPADLTLGVELEYVAFPEQPLTHESRHIRWEKTTEDLCTLVNESVRDGIYWRVPHEPGSQSLLIKKEVGLATFVGSEDEEVYIPDLDKNSHLKPEEVSDKDWEWMEEDEGGGPWVGIEVNTPAFAGTRCLETDVGLPSAIPELMAALRLNHRRIPVGINTNCGLHVHAGYADGLTLVRAKKITSLVLILDDALLLPLCDPRLRHDNYHCSSIAQHSFFSAPSQVGNSSTAAAINSGGGRKCSSDAKEVAALCKQTELACTLQGHDMVHDLLDPLEPDVGLGMRSMLLRIWSTTSIDALRCGLLGVTGCRRSIAICLRSHMGQSGRDGQTLVPAPDEATPSTVEFRHMQSTADPVLLGHWVAIVSAIMQVAVIEGEGTFAACFQTLARDADWTLSKENAEEKGEVWEKMLWHLGLEAQIPFWRGQRWWYAEGPLFPGTEGGVLMPGV